MSTIDDLRQALTDEAEHVPTQPNRLDRVRRAVVRRRRARVAGAALAMVVVAGGVVGIVRPTGAHRALTPATQDAALPEYRGGGKLIGQTSLPALIGSSRTFTVVPTGWGLSITDQCAQSGTRQVNLEVQVNGHPAASGGCGSSIRGEFEHDQRMWQSLGVRPGQPTTVSVRVVATPAAERAVGVGADVDSAAVTAFVGVYQDVPYETFPLPRRPATVQRPVGLGVDGNSGVYTQIERVSLPGPNGTWTTTRAYDRTLSMDGMLWAPGRYRVLVDGVVVGGSTSWDYGESGSGLDLSPTTLRDAGVRVPANGQPVTVTVQLDRFADPGWQLLLGLRAP
jgi:hypothetical protein